MPGNYDPQALVSRLQRTAVRDHMSLSDAMKHQFKLVDAIQRVMGSDLIFQEDYGQARELGSRGGGRPLSTARVEEVLANFFEAEDAALVPGAGTGSIRAMIDGATRRGTRILCHSAYPYKTTGSIFESSNLDVEPVDLNDLGELKRVLLEGPPDAVYIQNVPHMIDDTYRVEDVISTIREATGSAVLVLADDNYAVMRVPRIATQLGADVCAFSLFKLLARVNIGCVTGKSEIVARVRRRLSSAGSQVQGPDAMDALRSLVYAPVALALQNHVVIEASKEINRLIAQGTLPHLAGAVATQLSMRDIALVFHYPVAEEFLKAAWRNGSPSRSVGEEARYDVVPLFTYIAGTFIHSTPGIERYVVRINPLRGGTETIVRVLGRALLDKEFVALVNEYAGHDGKP